MRRSSCGRLRPAQSFLLAIHVLFTAQFSRTYLETAGAVSYLLRSHWLLRSLVQLLNSLLVVSQILLAADEDDGQALAEMQNLRDPL